MKLSTSSTAVVAVHVAVVYLVLLFIVSSSNACTLDGCDHPDCGSCGNACCSLSITVQEESTESVMHKLNNSITTDGGPDQLYIPMMTDEGTLTFYDRRPYKQEQDSGGADFIGQALHTTINGKYNDTINLSLSPTTTTISARNNHNNKKKKKQNSVKGTIISAFSISDIAGAYCDSGQNYWNLLQLIDSIQWENDDTPLIEHVGESCPTNTINTPPRLHNHKNKEETNDWSSEEEPEDNSFSSEDEKDMDSSSSTEDDTIPETTTTTTDDDNDDTENGNENNLYALSKPMDTTKNVLIRTIIRKMSSKKNMNGTKKSASSRSSSSPSSFSSSSTTSSENSDHEQDQQLPVRLSQLSTLMSHFVVESARKTYDAMDDTEERTEFLAQLRTEMRRSEVFLAPLVGNDQQQKEKNEEKNKERTEQEQNNDDDDNDDIDDSSSSSSSMSNSSNSKKRRDSMNVIDFLVKTSQGTLESITQEEERKAFKQHLHTSLQQEFLPVTIALTQGGHVPRMQ